MYHLAIHTFIRSNKNNSSAADTDVINLFVLIKECS